MKIRTWYVHISGNIAEFSKQWRDIRISLYGIIVPVRFIPNIYRVLHVRREIKGRRRAARARRSQWVHHSTVGQSVSQSLQSVCVLCTMGDHFENWSRSTSQITPTDRSELTQGCQTTPSNLAQSKERKDQILKHSGAIVQKPEGPNTYDL